MAKNPKNRNSRKATACLSFSRTMKKQMRAQCENALFTFLAFSLTALSALNVPTRPVVA